MRASNEGRGRESHQRPYLQGVDVLLQLIGFLLFVFQSSFQSRYLSSFLGARAASRFTILGQTGVECEATSMPRKSVATIFLP